MRDLTDEDIYTYVTLKDCELPVRKGSLTPINEGYANAGGAHRCAKYATLMRDINGNSMFIYTNPFAASRYSKRVKSSCTITPDMLPEP